MTAMKASNEFSNEYTITEQFYLDGGDQRVARSVRLGRLLIAYEDLPARSEKGAIAPIVQQVKELENFTVMEEKRQSVFMQMHNGTRTGEGSFNVALQELFYKAAQSNQCKLVAAFPEFFGEEVPEFGITKEVLLRSSEPRSYSECSKACPPVPQSVQARRDARRKDLDRYR